MRREFKLLVSAAGLALLSACADGTFAGMNFVAGSETDEGEFGKAVNHNLALMTNERNAVISLARRFAEEVPTTVTFAFDSARLDENAKAVLRQQADWIRQFPEVRFRVYGHTDKVGSEAYNKALGLRRARAVVNYLVSQGVSRSRLEAVVSFGETQPLIVTEGRERRNRRTVTEVTGFVKRYRGQLDGKYAEVLYREYLKSASEPADMGAGSQTGMAGGAQGG
ncbi:MAG: OmpA family protein [Alphaproteobacteria bacterium]|nr:MAG: OmpA family protein [Alphaproteobacteria bacterium]